MIGRDRGRGTLPGAAAGPMGAGSGPPGLVSNRDAAGLGAQAASGIGLGENTAASPAPVRAAFGGDENHRVAQEAGRDDAAAADGRAGLLADRSNGLTPDGTVPDGGDLESLAGKSLGR